MLAINSESKMTTSTQALMLKALNHCSQTFQQSFIKQLETKEQTQQTSSSTCMETPNYLVANYSNLNNPGICNYKNKSLGEQNKQRKHR